MIGRSLRFGVFEANLAARELRKHGVRVRLAGQPFSILSMLMEKAGEVVTREEMRQKLWAADTFVDFEHSLNSAIKKLRNALSDSAENSRYIETIPRIGYRFIAPIESLEVPGPPPAPATALVPPETGEEHASAKRSQAWLLVAGAVLLVSACLSVWKWRGSWRNDSGSEIRSLAVLPLDNLSGDPAQEYFADGMTDELITNLAQIQSLRLISRTSVMHYKGARKSIRQIAGDLNVDAVVEGTVLQSGNRVRISAQLIQVKNEKHLWAHSYESDVSDVLKLQQQVAKEIVEQIRPKVTPGEQARLTQARSVDPEAHEAYLKGRYVLEQNTVEGAKHAIGLFESAIEHDPEYAQAYSGLADSYSQLGGLLGAPDRTIDAKLRQAARKAAALDDGLAEAHASLGIEYQREWKWTESEKELQRAIELNSNYALAHLDYGYLMILSGETDRALSEFKRALELNPASPGTNMGLGWGYFFAQRYDEAIQQANTTVELNPGLNEVHLLLGVCYSHKGDEQKGFSEWLKVMRMSGDSQLADKLQHVAATAPAARAKERMGRVIVAYLLKKSKRQYVSPLEIARAYSGNVGDYAQAMVWLQKSYDEHVDTLPWIKLDPDFDGMRSNKRFRELQARMGVPSKAQALSSRP